MSNETPIPKAAFDAAYTAYDRGDRHSVALYDALVAAYPYIAAGVIRQCEAEASNAITLLLDGLGVAS